MARTSAVGIRPGGPAPLAFDAKEHSADKGVNGGFACFILAVDNIDAVLKGRQTCYEIYQIRLCINPENALLLTPFIGCEKQGMDSVKQRLFSTGLISGF